MTSQGDRRAAGPIRRFTYEPWFMGKPPHKGFPLVLGLITLDAKVQVPREVDAGNHRRDMTRENMRQNRQEADTGTGAKTGTPGCPAGQRKTVRGGLRMLAGVIARAGRNAPAHPRPFSGLFPRRGGLSPRHGPPRQSGIRHPDRNPALTPTVHCSGPVGGRFNPVSALKQPVRRLRSETQSPVHLRHSTRWAQVPRDP